MAETEKTVEEKEKQVVEIDSEKIDHWRNLVYEIYNELPEVDKIFTELIDRWRETRNNDFDVGSIMGVIQRSIRYTSEKVEKLSDEIWDFQNKMEKGDK